MPGIIIPIIITLVSAAVIVHCAENKGYVSDEEWRKDEMTDKQRVTAKWLNRAFEANIKLKALRAYRHSIAGSVGLKGVKYGGSTGGESNENAMELALAEYCDELADIDKEINAQVLRVRELDEEIRGGIRRLHDSRLESILIYRHLACIEPGKAAKAIGYSSRHERRLYSEALEKMSAYVR